MEEGLITTDAPVETSVESTATGVDTHVDTQVDASEPADGSTGPQSTEPEPQPDKQPITGPPIVDGRLNPAIKPILEKLKAENPQAEKAIREALFRESRLAKELPGGLQELQQLRQQIEEIGGEDGIHEITGELNGWRSFDEQYTSGDPKVLEFLTETPEAAAAFLKIAPAAFEKFRELNPEGYGALVCQTFLADMMQERVPLLLERLGDLLPQDNPKALEILKALQGYVQRIHGYASKQVVPPATAKPAGDDPRAKELEARETALRRTEWRSESASLHKRLYETAWTQQLGDRKLTNEQRITVQEIYGLKLQKLIATNPKFNETLQRYFANGQKDGFMKYIESAYRDAVPKALKTAIAQAGIGAKSGPTAGKPVAAPGKASPLPPKPATGFKLVNKKPNVQTEVDRVNTTPDMLLKGQAILKTGERVTWRIS